MADAGASRPLHAFLWMCGAVASFSLMAVAGREIQAEMNTFELMFYRSVIGLGVVALVLWRSPGGFAQIRTARLDLHLRRNVVHFSGQNLWFFAVATIPLGQLVALEFTNPLWVALLAPMALGEALTRPKLAAAALGFAGVLIVARPGSSALELGHAAALVAAFAFAGNTLYTKRIMQIDGVLCVLFWMTLLQSAFSLVLALPGGIPLPSEALAPWLLVVGLTGLSAHYALTSALGEAPATIVAPMEFLRLPVISIIGLWLYDEPLRGTLIIGAGLIIAANLLNVWSGRRRRGPA